MLCMLTALRLYEHPEGADTWPTDEDGARTVCNIQECNEFVEARMFVQDKIYALTDRTEYG